MKTIKISRNKLLELSNILTGIEGCKKFNYAINRNKDFFLPKIKEIVRGHKTDKVKQEAFMNEDIEVKVYQIDLEWVPEELEQPKYEILSVLVKGE